MSYFSARLAARLVVLAASYLAAGCIGPQGAAKACPCTCDKDSPAAASSDAKPAAAHNDAPVPDPVVPTGPMIWDGAGISNLPTIEPPGSWFVYSDKTAGGVKKPAAVEEFASAIENGAIHTTGRGIPSGAAGSAPTCAARRCSRRWTGRSSRAFASRPPAPRR